MTPEAQETKGKTDAFDFMEIRTLRASKKTVRKVQRQAQEGEDVYEPCVCQERVTSSLCNVALSVRLKLDEGSEETLLRRRHTAGRCLHGRVCGGGVPRGVQIKPAVRRHLAHLH